MKFPGNCLIVSVIAVAVGGGRMRYVRNAAGRIHFYWVDRNGWAFEFYTRGASRHGYLRNSLRMGTIERCPARDEPVPVGEA